MSIRSRVRLPTYSDEDDLFAVYSSPFVYELEDFCGRVVDVGGGLLSVEVGLCGEGGRSGCHWSGGVGREGGLCDMEKVVRTSGRTSHEWTGGGGRRGVTNGATGMSSPISRRQRRWHPPRGSSRSKKESSFPPPRHSPPPSSPSHHAHRPPPPPVRRHVRSQLPRRHPPPLLQVRNLR